MRKAKGGGEFLVNTLFACVEIAFSSGGMLRPKVVESFLLILHSLL